MTWGLGFAGLGWLGESLLKNLPGFPTLRLAATQDVRADLAAAVVKSGWPLYQLRNVGMSLEEVFLQLTTQESAEPLEGEPEPEPGEAVEAS